MKRTIIALVLITITIASALAGSIAYLAAINSQDNKSPSASPLATSTPIFDSSSQETNSASPTPTTTQTTTPGPTSSSTPIATPAPAPTNAPNSAYPEGLNNWLPYATLAVLSPTNQTYNITTSTLNVSGGLVITKNPSLSYSLDGGSRFPLTVELTKISMAQTSISASTSLTNLAKALTF